MICRTKSQMVRIILILIKCICLHACSVCEDIVGKHGRETEVGYTECESRDDFKKGMT